jgi:hypothetical protein
VQLRKCSVRRLDFVGGLADDIEVANDRILYERVPDEGGLIQPIDISFDARDRLEDMFD